MDTRTYEDKVAAEVRAEAGRKDMSRAALAERTGISVSSLRRYIYRRDEGKPIPLDALHLIAKALDLPTSELLARAETEPSAIRPASRVASPQSDAQPHLD